MEEPLLSREETEALLGAMQSAEEGTDVEEVDLTSPERRIRSALSIADKAGDEIADMLRRSLLRHAGAPSRTEASPAEINPLSVAVGAVRPGSAIGRLRIGDSFGFITIGPKLVSFILERQMGAPLRMDDAADAEESGPRETLTPVDRRVLRPILQEICAELSRKWCGETDVIHLRSVETDAPDAQGNDAYEPVLRIACDVKPTVAPGDEVSIVLAASAVSVTFAPGEEVEENPISPSERQRLRRRVDVTQVEMAAILGTTEVSIRQVLELELGDVIRLDGVPGKPVSVRANGVTVLRGRPVTKHGNLAIEITQPFRR